MIENQYSRIDDVAVNKHDAFILKRCEDELISRLKRSFGALPYQMIEQKRPLIRGYILRAYDLGLCADHLEAMDSDVIPGVVETQPPTFEPQAWIDPEAGPLRQAMVNRVNGWTPQVIQGGGQSGVAAANLRRALADTQDDMA